MGRRDDEFPPLTEPVIVQCLVCTGMAVQLHGRHLVRLVGWVDLPNVDHEQPERRVMARLVLPDDVARTLSRDLHRALARGGH